ncbi:hypothetical protein TNCV_3438201 [Trichonephila clavipes]|nr:hypothetical protein TNCV_3438201 [Trichonephila clavipes]
MATGSSLTQNHSRSQSEIQGDLHISKETKDISGHSDIPVIDGTWRKHGHTSLNGTVIATSVDTGKVCLMLQFW